MDDSIVRRQSSYASYRLAFPDPIIREIDEEFLSPRTPAAAERYLTSNCRRVFEFVITLLLLILLLPLLGLISLGVRLTSPGTILFKQWRHGKDMVAFELLRFRTMYWTNSVDPAVRQAARDDSRVTPVGRILRSTSMDELPQLISVIKGEMSLSGPRSHAVEHDFYYRESIPHYCERFRARSRMTGPAQVNGDRGATPHVIDMKHRNDLDSLYLQQASLMLDCRILLRTIKEVFASNSAFQERQRMETSPSTPKHTRWLH